MHEHGNVGERTGGGMFHVHARRHMGMCPCMRTMHMGLGILAQGELADAREELAAARLLIDRLGKEVTKRDGVTIDREAHVSAIISALGGGSHAARIAQVRSLHVGRSPHVRSPHVAMRRAPCTVALDRTARAAHAYTHAPRTHAHAPWPYAPRPWIAQLELDMPMPMCHAPCPRTHAHAPWPWIAQLELDNLTLRNKNRSLRVTTVWQQLMLQARKERLQMARDSEGAGPDPPDPLYDTQAMLASGFGGDGESGWEQLISTVGRNRVVKGGGGGATAGRRAGRRQAGTEESRKYVRFHGLATTRKLGTCMGTCMRMVHGHVHEHVHELATVRALGTPPRAPTLIMRRGRSRH